MSSYFAFKWLFECIDVAHGIGVYIGNVKMTLIYVNVKFT